MNPHPRWPRELPPRFHEYSELRNFLVLVREQAWAKTCDLESTRGRFTQLMDRDRKPAPLSSEEVRSRVRQLVWDCVGLGDQDVLNALAAGDDVDQQLAVEYDAYLERRLV